VVVGVWPGLALSWGMADSHTITAMPVGSSGLMPADVWAEDLGSLYAEGSKGEELDTTKTQGTDDSAWEP